MLIAVGCIFFGPSRILQFSDSLEDYKFCSDMFGSTCYDRMDQTKPNYKQFCDDLLRVCNGEVRDNSKTMLIIGLIFLGTASGSVIVPILVELVTAVKDAIGAKPGANEKGSALFTMFGAIGSILATIIGSVLYEVLDNRITSDIFAILSLLMALLFFLMNIKPGYLHKKAKNDISVPQNASAYNNLRVTQSLQ